MDLTYIDDIVEGIVLGMKHRPKECHRVYDIGTGSANSIKTIAKLLGDELGKTVKLVSEVCSVLMF